MIYTLGERRLETRSTEFYVAPSAQLIGSVRLGHQASIWFNAVLRGDNDWIEIGDGSNVQDGTVIHVDPGFPVLVGSNATVGHMAFLHSCTVGDAGALVPPDKVIPDGVIVMGSPAKVVREVTDEDRQRIAHAADVYCMRARQYRAQLQSA